MSNIDPSFPVFVLCGILISEASYQGLIEDFRRIRNNYCGGKRIIFHSRDIRKWQNGFEFLYDEKLRTQFYEDLNNVIGDGQDYWIIAAGINKEKHLRKYGRLSFDVYQGFAINLQTVQ